MTDDLTQGKHRRWGDGQLINTHTEEFLRERCTCPQFTADADPAAMPVAGLYRMPDHSQNGRMVGVIKAVQLLILSVDCQRILRQIIGSQGEVLAVRDAYRAQEWAMLIQECSASGLTKREFCQQRGISEKSFYYWLKKLRTQMVGAAAPQLVQLEPPPAEDSILEIHYRGTEMKLPSGVDMDAVAALLRSIQSL